MKQYHDVVRHNRNGFDKVHINSYDKDKIENDNEFVSTQPAHYNYYGYGKNAIDPQRQPHTEMPAKVTQYIITLKTKYCVVPINGDK
jgi:hypothetical protein